VSHAPPVDGPGGAPPDAAAAVAAARPLIALALAEDLGARGDVTSAATVGADVRASARLVARADGVVAGLPVARAVAESVDAAIRFEAVLADGARARRGDVIARLSGPARSLLAAERTLLNFLQRLSGVASQAARHADALAGTGVRVLDTRKTTPGWRVLEKYAVAAGGGANHRMGLFDLVLIKDNHAAAAGGVGNAVAAALAARPAGVRVEVEVRAPDDIEAALAHPVDGLMFDNMTPEAIDAAVALVDRLQSGRSGPRPFIEVSGGITLATIREHARPGVDFISVGALTHSAPALDIALDFEEGAR
jgi:nicotinate-nucleotide pyrophosphorylase (carboxylating)